MGIGNVIAIVAILGLIAALGVTLFMLMRAQAFLMMANSPHAAVEVLKSMTEKRYEKAERQKATEKAKKRERYLALCASGEATPEQIKEFGIGE